MELEHPLFLDELLLRIFSCLDEESLLSVMVCCKKWRVVARDKEIIFKVFGGGDCEFWRRQDFLNRETFNKYRKIERLYRIFESCFEDKRIWIRFIGDKKSFSLSNIINLSAESWKSTCIECVFDRNGTGFVATIELKRKLCSLVMTVTLFTCGDNRLPVLLPRLRKQSGCLVDYIAFFALWYAVDIKEYHKLKGEKNLQEAIMDCKGVKEKLLEFKKKGEFPNKIELSLMYCPGKKLIDCMIHSNKWIGLFEGMKTMKNLKAKDAEEKIKKICMYPLFRKFFVQKKRELESDYRGLNPKWIKCSIKHFI